MTQLRPPLDSLGMFELAAGLPEQVRQAAVDAEEVIEGIGASSRFSDSSWIENILVLGMGGSGMAGEVVAAVTADSVAVPVVVVKGYEAPAFVGPQTLVLAVSASGNTEETLQAASDAAEAGATLAVVSGDGELARLAASLGAPRFVVPDYIPQPRAALGAMVAPPLVLLEHLGLYRGARAWISAAVQQLQVRRDALESAGEASEAAEVARRIGRTIPLVHGGGRIGAVAAQRWKTQVNENAKAPAWWAVQPELCHNEVCGWAQHGDVTRQVLTAVFLRHDSEHPQVGRRFELVGEIMREVVAGVVEVRAAGEGALAQALDLILFGDYVSLWMAALAGVDPGPVPILAELKSALAGG